MRAWNKQPSNGMHERDLGEIAPLLEAARQVESLSPEERKQVRKRIARTLFGIRRRSLRARLVPVLVVMALLVLGGAAYATAQRLGLLPGPSHKEAGAPATEPAKEARKRKAARGQSSLQPEKPAADDAEIVADLATVVLPEVPDPLLYPLSETSLPAWAPLADDGQPRVATVGAEPRADARPAATWRSAMRPSVRPVALRLPEGAAPAALPAHAIEAPSLAPAPVVVPPVAPLVAPPPPPRSAPEPNPASADQALFGKAMRKLRSDNNPSAALAALHEHARAYPRSVLGGERTALEVEALLALHRDREALALLDTLPLDHVPRSGERFVVRGELRAAARRWREASEDFDRALALVSGSPTWHERALWGRGVARLRLGQRESGMADIERYRASYPRGRFAAEAAKFFPEQ